MAFDCLMFGSLKTQGAIKGESVREGHEEKLEVIAFNWGVLCPKDPSSGLSTGRRQHQPVCFTKNFGASSPQWAQAAWTNEHYEELTFEFWQTNDQGVQEIYMTLVLRNGSVSKISYGTGSSGDDHATSRTQRQYDLKETETIEIVFEEVIFTHVLEGVEAADSWKN